MDKKLLLQTLVNVVMTFASPQVMRALVDGILDIIEDAVEKSENQIDDTIVLPVCRQVREVFNVPDDDYTTM